MAKRRRAGGGRKPKGEFSELTSPLSFRMPERMWKELQAAKRKSGRSATQEMLRRLQYSFNEDRRKSRDPALQALLYLIGEAAEGVTNTYEFRVKDMRPLWRSNPFLFRAFKLAVSKLLDALEPAGDIKSPATLEITENVTLDLTAPNFVRDIYQTPETLADFVAAGILQGLVRTAPPKKSDPHPTKWDYADHYDWDSARRDLGIKPEREKP